MKEVEWMNFDMITHESLVYNYDKAHPIAKPAAVIWSGLITFILLLTLLRTGWSIVILACFFISLYLLYRTIANLKKYKIIVFTDDSIKISWNSAEQTIEEIIPISDIKKIKFGIYSVGRYIKYTIEIETINKQTIADISMTQHNELKEYFKRYCSTHDIDLRGAAL